MSTTEGAKLVKKLDMRVAAKVLQQLASGIYRSPAGAIKELLNNSFDADATRVDITMQLNEKNRQVEGILVRDNGRGMDLGEFEWFAEHVGASVKRIEGNTTQGGRPLIGRIGIGLLSVGHATNWFTVASTTLDDEFIIKAEVDLSPYYDVRLQVQTLDELRVGNVSLYKLPKDFEGSMTEVEFGDVKDPFSRDLASPPASKEKAFDWAKSTYAEFVDWLDKSQIARLEQLSGFSKFMFDTGLISPVSYLPHGPVRGYENSNVIRTLTRRLTEYNFHVFVNGTEVFKPILLPHQSDHLEARETDYKLYEISIKSKLAEGRNLSALGYYYHQVKRLNPLAIRGVLLRVNDVGIGSYENSFAKIYNQSPIVLHQLTGELYVDEGLDGALNIDRNSFFESDEAFQRLWTGVFALLNPEQLSEQTKEPQVTAQQKSASVTRDIKRRLELRNRASRVKKDHRIKSGLIEKVGDMLETSRHPRTSPEAFTIEFSPRTTPHAVITKTKTGVSDVHVYLHKNLREPTRSILVLILVAVELTLGKKSPIEVRASLGKMLAKVF